jgi:serine/threonine-protein kinase
VSPDPPSQYEQLTPEEVAQIDAVCLRFERAWKEASAGGPVPCLASFLDQSHGSAREVLNWELIALDQACRERYGFAVGAEDASKSGVGGEAWTDAPTRPMRRPTAVTAGPLAGWPSLPGLELLAVLGSGGMGVVFKARQAKLDREVAVKFLRDAHRADSGQRQRFLQEARAVARLRHPHLVQVYEFGEVPAAGGATSQPYLVLEYVPGGSLADLLRGSPQPPREAARLVETVAEAIHYAHQQGVIHRDLKPANVLLQRAEVQGAEPAEGVRGLPAWPPRALTADLCAKVTDFGLAKFLAGSDLTRSGEMLGTPSYMAPEQAAGKPGAISAAVDVYGLGTILYETLTGRPPFAAATVDATLALVRQEEPVPPRRLQPTVPRDLETICLKCLRKEPGRRYGSAEELAEDLRRFRAGELIRARPVGLGERLLVWCRRKPGVAALLAALVLVLLAGSSGVLWQWQVARDNAAEAERNAADYRRERDIALHETERANHHLQIVRKRVNQLNQLGSDLLQRPGLYRTGQEVLEEALAFYKAMLPEDSNDPGVRREAAQLYRHVAKIHDTLGQTDKAAEVYGQQADLLTRLLEAEPTDKDLRMELANSHRWRGIALLALGKAREAREAYEQAADLHDGLLHESPDDAFCQVALANTLLNCTYLLSRRDQAEELESLFRRILKLDRAAVHTVPDNAWFDFELALALEEHGMFWLETGRHSHAEAEATVHEAVAIYRKLLAGGQLKGSIERNAARAFVSLGRVLTAAGRVGDAEQAYREAVQLLDPFVRDFPESAAANEELAWLLATSAEPRLRDAARAVELAQKAVNAQPKSSNYRNTLGVAHYRNGDHKAAVAELEMAVSLREGGAEGFDGFFLAMAYWRLGDRDQARTWFNRAVEWMDTHRTHDDELRRFRAEAEALLAEARKP